MHFFIPYFYLFSVVAATGNHNNSNINEPLLVSIQDQLLQDSAKGVRMQVQYSLKDHVPIEEALDQLHDDQRNKKSTGGGSPYTRWSDLNDGNRFARIVYSGIINSEVIYVLTYNLDNNEDKVISSNLYRSSNYGDSFDRISARVRYATLTPYVYVDPSDHEKVFVIDAKSAKIYSSDNEGLSFTSIQLYPETIDPYSIIVHPSKGDWLLARDSTNNILYVSRDLGRTAFTKLSDNVRINDEYRWGDNSFDLDNSIVYFTSVRVLYTQKYPYSDKQQFSPSFTGLLKDFLLTDRYIFVVDNINKLWVSVDRRPLKQTLLPSNSNYYISSIRSMQVLVVALNYSNQYNLYLSDEQGLYYYHSLAELVVEARTVQSILGPTIIDLVTLPSTNYSTFIANQWVQSGSHKRTLISLDAGRTWDTITDNDTTECYEETSCSLHFHIYTNKYWRAGIFSSASAPGIAIAHGIVTDTNEGYQYKTSDISNLYITRDGGVTWTKTLSGTWLMNVLDHGSLLVAAHDHHTDTYTSRTLVYSCDEGLSWSSFTFTNQPVSIYGVITEPGKTTTVISLFGTPDTVPQEWSVFVVEFRNIFTHVCQPNDYYVWTPFPPMEKYSDSRCFLGASVTVERRRPDVCCYNSHTYVRVVNYDTCQCTREEYECDYGYKPTSAYNGLCIRDDVISLDTSCVEGEDYKLISKGYRKIGGNACSGGVFEESFEHVNITCCPKEDASTSNVTDIEQIYMYSLVAACVLLLILILIIISLCVFKCNRKRHRPHTKPPPGVVSSQPHHHVTDQEQFELRGHSTRHDPPVVHNTNEVLPAHHTATSSHSTMKEKPYIKRDKGRVATTSMPPDYSKLDEYSYPVEKKGFEEKHAMHPMEEEIIEKFDYETCHYY